MTESTRFTQGGSYNVSVFDPWNQPMRKPCPNRGSACNCTGACLQPMTKDEERTELLRRLRELDGDSRTQDSIWGRRKLSESQGFTIDTTRLVKAAKVTLLLSELGEMTGPGWSLIHREAVSILGTSSLDCLSDLRKLVGRFDD